MSPIHSIFEEHSYVVLPRFLKEPELSFCLEYALSTLKRGALASGDSMLPRTPAAYGDPVMDTLLEKMTPTVEQECGYKIYPTYSYFRIYQNGDELPRHRDRPACEISVSVCLGIQSQGLWPLWIESNGRDQPIDLCAGDALLYKGIELWHWRNSFHGIYAAQVFFHYVRQDGPNREWKFDKRQALRMRSVNETVINRESRELTLQVTTQK